MTRGKVFLYELHTSGDVTSAAARGRGRGVGRALVDLVERSGSSRGRSSPTVELNVHAGNVDAQGFYEHIGFGKTGETRDGLAHVMRRKR